MIYLNRGHKPLNIQQETYMNKLLIGLLITGALVLSGVSGLKLADRVRSNGLTQESGPAAPTAKLPPQKDLLADTQLKAIDAPKGVLTLEAGNTVVFRGPVTQGSVSDAIRKIQKISRTIGKKDVIYLVLDTPGGSVTDGAEFIDFLAGLPQEVRTVTLFAASMGFHIAESNPGKRLIARNGVLMSHRATLNGLGGQLDGELETRYRMIKREIDYLELTAANRLGLSLDQYKKTIKDEYWVRGYDSIDNKVADEMTLVQCGESMVGTDDIKIDTFFGELKVSFDKCPLVREPVSISLGQIRADAQPYVKGVMEELFNNQKKFVEEIILTDKFNKIFPNGDINAR